MTFLTRFFAWLGSARWAGILVIMMAFAPFLTAQSFCPADMVACDMDGAAQSSGGVHGCDLACAALLGTTDHPVLQFLGRVRPAVALQILLAKGHITETDLRPPIFLSNT